MADFFRSHVLATFGVMALFSAAAIAAPPPQGQNQNKDAVRHPLAWAYAVPVGPPRPPAPPPTAAEDAAIVHLPGSSVTYTGKQLRNSANALDWFPNDHPPMPEIVAHRRSPTANPWVGSCAWCHLPTGLGRPENAPLAGLPEGYILEQLSDFKNGARKSADPGKKNTATMAGNAAGLTKEEALAAAKYFSSLKMTPWIKVVETNTVPKYHNVMGFYYAPSPGNETVPIGDQLLEMPVSAEQTELHSPKASWIVYVPVGTLKKGEDLVVRGGNGKTVACAACHGEGLKGNENFPPLAGRSPSYLGRQLYDIQQYTRNGPGAELMRPIVKNLTQDDIMAITAYLASLHP
ncbi:MAG TPA: c-type cytochrome [Candidatus Dormibacteraeota bacterium]|nr:c-type cytochrome [Candidatus Dormibacteraeota bacterium]